MKIGFIDLGAMDAPMAARLVQAGHAVRGFDVRVAAVEAFAAAGGEVATSAYDAARDAEFLWLMVVSGEQAEAVLFAGEGGGAAGALPPILRSSPPLKAQRSACPIHSPKQGWSSGQHLSIRRTAPSRVESRRRGVRA